MNNTNITSRYSLIFPLKILLLITIQFLAIVCIIANGLPLKIFGVLLFGFMNAHTIQIIHQCSHFTGFKSKRLNDLTGKILGLFVFIDFKTYRLEHFEHHKNLGTLKDSEFFGFERITNASSVIKMIPFIFGFYKYKSLGRSFFSSEKKRRNSTLRLMISLLALISISIYLGHINVVIAWVVSLILITEPVHFMIEIPEHYGCKKISSEKYENTRTIKNASFVAKWFTNWNNFHVEHHLNQWVMPEELEKFHKPKISEKFKPQFNNYFEFYSFLLKDIFKPKITQ